MFFTKKWLTSHIQREHESLEESSTIKNNDLIQNEFITSNHNSKIENVNNNKNNVNSPNVSTYENHAYVVIGPRNVGQTYYMLKMLERKGNRRPIHIITRSPNQNPKFETSNEIKPKNKYKGQLLFLTIR